MADCCPSAWELWSRGPSSKTASSSGEGREEQVLGLVILRLLRDLRLHSLISKRQEFAYQMYLPSSMKCLWGLQLNLVPIAETKPSSRQKTVCCVHCRLLGFGCKWRKAITSVWWHYAMFSTVSELLGFPGVLGFFDQVTKQMQKVMVAR